jgi:hypothetical protein
MAADVTLSAWPEQWHGIPADLAATVTPLLVRIENMGASDVLIRYDHFELTDPLGRSFEAIPPFELDETVAEPVEVTPRYPLGRFRVAPHLRPFYRTLVPFEEQFAVDPVFWERYRTEWVNIDLPTADMVQMVLPEGVLEPGGVATGFVYFEPLTEDPAQVSLDYRLVTPAGDDLGRVSIPFVVRSEF